MLFDKRLIIAILFLALVSCQKTNDELPIEISSSRVPTELINDYSRTTTIQTYEEDSWLSFGKNTSGLGKAEVYGIAVASDGSIWFGTEKGVFQYTPTQ